MTAAKIVVTTGEPAGIGPDVTLQMLQAEWPATLLILADPELLAERAKQLKLPIQINLCASVSEALPHRPGSINVLPIKLSSPATAGQLNSQHAEYVIRMLNIANDLCLNASAQAIVTAPVHKAIINAAGYNFTGHTEFFAEAANIDRTVMLFVTEHLKVALATTHLPLKAVSTAISKQLLTDIVLVMQQGLRVQFNVPNPHIAVCGLNPHAGENGVLGREELDIIQPTIFALNKQGLHLSGPLPADTLFTPHNLAKFDAVLAMYHDQALPVVKYAGFGNAVNVTLGLPYIRTSVDHGTALDLAGTGKADASSMRAALSLAIKLTLQNCHS